MSLGDNKITLGKSLAKYLFTLDILGDINWSDTEIDISSLSPETIISVFFNAFLQEIFDIDEDKLKLARNFKWIVEHDFQQNNIKV